MIDVQELRDIAASLTAVSSILDETETKVSDLWGSLDGLISRLVDATDQASLLIQRLEILRMKHNAKV